MGVTQSMIADRVGLDTSTINKILNRVPGPKFHPKTIARVFKTAREMGYKHSTAGKWELMELAKDQAELLQDIMREELWDQTQCERVERLLKRSKAVLRDGWRKLPMCETCARNSGVKHRCDGGICYCACEE